MILTVDNPETTDLEKSYLANPYTAGTTSIEVKNNDRFVANDRIMLGEMGHEKTEVVTVSAVNANGTTITTGATLFDHPADTPVYKLRFDQAKFYRSTDGIDGTYSVVSTQALDVDNANLTTIYDDVSGLSTYYYKMTVYHSISAVESEYSDPIGGTGWRREQVGAIIDEILQEVGDQQEQHVTRSEMLGYFNDVNDDLQTAAAKPYNFLHTRTTLTKTAGQNYINFPVDSNGKQTMWKFDRLDYNYTDGTTDMTSTLRVYPAEEFRNIFSDNTNDSVTQTDSIKGISLDTAVNRFRLSNFPATTEGAAFYLYYWKYFNTINSEGDIIETPTPRIYKLYCKAMFYRKRAYADLTLDNQAQSYMNDYLREKASFKALDRKDQGTPRSFRPQTSTIKAFRR